MDVAATLADMQRRIILLEDHAQRGLIDRGELRRETAVLREQVEQLKRIADVAAEDHVDQSTFAVVVERLSLVQRIVFGAIAVILLAVLSSLVALVVHT